MEKNNIQNNSDINFDTSKYGITPETKEKVNNKLRELWEPIAKNAEINMTESQFSTKEENNNVERIVAEIIKSRADKLNEKLAVLQNWHNIKDYIYNDKLLLSYSTWFWKSVDMIKKAISDIFKTKFWKDLWWNDRIKEIDMLKELEIYFSSQKEEFDLSKSDLSKLIPKLIHQPAIYNWKSVNFL